MGRCRRVAPQPDPVGRCRANCWYAFLSTSSTDQVFHGLTFVTACCLWLRLSSAGAQGAGAAGGRPGGYA